MNYCSINLNQIHECYHPRKDFTGQEELKGIIEKESLGKQPITVRKDGETYFVIDGLRRLRAVKELGFKEIDCIIEEVDEKTAAHLSYRMNSDELRKNLNPIEVALHIKTMQERFNYSVENLVSLRSYGKKDTIYNKLRLLTLPQKIQQQIAEGEIDPTAGYHLAKLKDEDLQLKIAEDIPKNEDVTRKVQKKVKILIDSNNPEKEVPKLEIPEGEIPGVFIKDASDMSELKDESVGLIVTSPPYGVGLEYEKDVTFEEHLKNLEIVFSECVRVLKPGGKIGINFGDIQTFGTRTNGKPEIQLMGHFFQEILRKHNVRLIDTIIWKKCTKGKRDFNWSSNPQANYHDKKRHTTYRIVNNTEYIHVFEKDGKRDVTPEIEDASRVSEKEYNKWNDGVWEIHPVQGKKGHPAPFPEEIPRRFIKLYSYIGDIVLDPFGGSMTTVKVAKELGRVGIGYERDAKYKSAIMEKLGIKEEDLKKPDNYVVHNEKKENESNIVDRFGKSVSEILATENRSQKDIRSIQVPYKSDFSKEEIVIDWAPDPEEPDPSGSPNLPAVVRADDYDGEKSYPLITLPKKKLDTAPYINTVILGDCLKKLKPLSDNSVDLLVTDPPYGIKFMGKDWDKAIPPVDIWKESLRVLKPGAFAFVMSAPRQDVLSRMITRLEDAGFIINFTPLYWTYATGFPKAYNIAKGIEGKLKLGSANWSEWKKLAGKKGVNTLGYSKLQHQQGFRDKNYQGQERNITVDFKTPEAKKFDGSYAGFQPKPAVEVIIVATKPMDTNTYVDQVLDNGKGITWMGDCRIPYKSNDMPTSCRRTKDFFNEDGKHELWNASNEGRFPANLLVSDDVLNDGKEHPGGGIGGRSNHGRGDGYGFRPMGDNAPTIPQDTGGYSRFFSLDAWAERNLPFLIVPKASKKEKNAGLDTFKDKAVNDGRKKDIDNPFQRGTTPRKNTHPTVKPVQLMSYLITMGSREGDVVLDPFCGSATSCVAAKMLNRKFIGIELSEEYHKIATQRVETAALKKAA